jgi:hypothetical protein
MFDELERLASDPNLKDLLSHYALLGQENRELWHPRLAQLADNDSRSMSRLYGALIAFGWVEQNTGGPGCSYRITSTGFRALRRAANLQELNEDWQAEAA